MKNRVVILFFLIFLVAFPACVNEALLPSKQEGEGKEVQIELTFKVPPALSPSQIQSRSVSASEQFTVNFEDLVPVDTRSSGTTELFNLWLFQFYADGTIHGTPQKVSDQVNLVNDMALLNATLRVGENQILYLVALGQQVTTSADLSSISNFSQLENVSLDYLDNKNGLVHSRITNESEIPYGGCVKGITVRELHAGDDKGEIVYGTPDAFFGGIEIKRLVSRIMIKHKLDITENTLDGLRLLNVPSKLFINSSAVSQDDINNVLMVDVDAAIAFDQDNIDADGFFTTEWYVAQNKQGTVDLISAERDRYRKVDDGTGLAPKLGTNIEVWSYAKTNRSLYTVHQIFVGNNNTDNFDVEVNHYYNLRTIINSRDQADKRIRSYSSVQKCYLSAHGSTSSGTGSISGSIGVYFDAHYGWRPMFVYAHGRKVSVGVYADQQCTQLVDPQNSWLQLSTYDNYTDVVRNGGLTNMIEADIYLPTRLKFYLYADEYIFNEDGSVTDYTFDNTQIYNWGDKSGATLFLKDRTLYVRVVTEEIGAEGTAKKLIGTYTIKQKQGFYAGQFGGDLHDGEYSSGLIMDGVDEFENKFDDTNLNAHDYIYFGYWSIFTNYVWDRTNNEAKNYPSFVNGKQSTYKLATNPQGYSVNTNLESIISPMRKINGVIDLYQYRYHNTFAARYCHDLNRDKNGNGIIDYLPNDPEANEMKWYMPAIRQALGMRAVEGIMNYSRGALALASEFDAINAYGSNWVLGGWNSSNSAKDGWKELRCVRDIPIPRGKEGGTKITTYVDRGVEYIMVDLTKLPNGTLDRTKGPGYDELYEELDLYSYSSTGELFDPDNPKADASKPLGIRVKRVIRNESKKTNNSTARTRVADFSSPKFIVSPTDVYNDGDTKSNINSEILKNAYDVPQPNRITMHWAQANGRLNTANTTDPTLTAQATNTGCYMYKGKNGTDTPGTWRVPNHRELSMILLFAKDMEKYATQTEFKKIMQSDILSSNLNRYTQRYWSSTEETGVNRSAAFGYLDYNYAISMELGQKKGYFNEVKLRCIKDIP